MSRRLNFTEEDLRQFQSWNDDEVDKIMNTPGELEPRLQALTPLLKRRERLIAALPTKAAKKSESQPKPRAKKADKGEKTAPPATDDEKPESRKKKGDEQEPPPADDASIGAIRKRLTIAFDSSAIAEEKRDDAVNSATGGKFDSLSALMFRGNADDLRMVHRYLLSLLNE